MKPSFLYRRLLAFLLAVGAVPALPTWAEEPRTNVLLIMADDLGWKDLGCQGNDRLHTPRLDALARQGVRFTNAYAASPVCSPTRGALITGLAPARLRITQHGQDGAQFWPPQRPLQPPPARHVLPLESLTIAERLRTAGYATGFFGKWHLSGDPDRRNPPQSGPSFWPEHQGFDVNLGGCGFGGPPTYFDPYRIPSIKPRRAGEYLTDRLADETIDFMRRHAGQRPMFICLWTYNVHYPFEAPEELIDRYRGQEGPGLKNPVYAAQIEATDRAVGRVLDALDELELAAQTLVIFTSDNGGWDGATDNRPLRSGKGDLYEGGLRVPLLVRWPGVTSSSSATDVTLETPVISMDLSATILAAAHVELSPQESLDGVDLKPLLRGEAIERDALYFHYPHYAWHRSNRPGGAIRSGPYKFIRRYDDSSRELYNLSLDIGEQHNLAEQLPELAAQFDERLSKWLSEVDAQMPTPVPAVP